MQEHDVIIIGAGLAGLTAGAKLAKEGKQVLLLEQHSKIGGCATTFNRKIAGQKVTFEVGLHEMDGLDNENDLKVKYFKDLGVFDNVDFVRVPEFYRFTNGRTDVVVPHHVPDAIDSLSKVFPEEKEAIRTFFSDVSSIFGNYERMMEFSTISVGAYLDSLTSNEDLKFALANTAQAPALLVAATNSGLEILAMAPAIIGYLHPNISVTFVFIIWLHTSYDQ